MHRGERAVENISSAVLVVAGALGAVVAVADLIGWLAIVPAKSSVEIILGIVA
jgi:hypothetical protein